MATSPPSTASWHRTSTSVSSPRLNAGEAGRKAVAEVKADPPGHDGDAADLTGVRAKQTRLAIYRTGVPRGDVGTAVLVYVVEVSNDANVRDMVFIDAETGKPLNRYSMIHDGLYRELYEGNTNRSNRVWDEGEAFPGDLNEEQQNLVAGTGESYWFFMNAFGQDSYDGLGATMTTVNNDPRINCPNANWNGITTNYCNGVTSDDVVAHEWGHAYTEYSWDGYLPVAVGSPQRVLLRRLGRDRRPDQRPPGRGRGRHRHPARRSASARSTPGARSVWSSTRPHRSAGPCTAAPAAFGPVFTQAGVTDDVVVATDAAPGHHGRLHGDHQRRCRFRQLRLRRPRHLHLPGQGQQRSGGRCDRHRGRRQRRGPCPDLDVGSGRASTASWSTLEDGARIKSAPGRSTRPSPTRAPRPRTTRTAG